MFKAWRNRLGYIGKTTHVSHTKTPYPSQPSASNGNVTVNWEIDGVAPPR